MRIYHINIQSRRLLRLITSEDIAAALVRTTVVLGLALALFAMLAPRNIYSQATIEEGPAAQQNVGGQNSNNQNANNQNISNGNSANNEARNPAEWSNLAQRSQRLARESGFRDFEVDVLHSEITVSLNRLINDPEIPTLPAYENEEQRAAVYADRLAHAVAPRIVKGETADGTGFFRIMLREDLAYGTEPRPSRYLIRTHCYLFFESAEQTDPHAEDEPGNANSRGTTNNTIEIDRQAPRSLRLKRIMFQYYLVNYSGVEYRREIRRLTHPGPFPVEGTAGDWTAPRESVENVGADSREQTDGEASDSSLVDNSELQLEYYQQPADVRPAWEGVDGVPVPELAMQPEYRLRLGNQNSGIPFERQIRILQNYKDMLRIVDRIVHKRRRSYELERDIIIQTMTEFPL
ncbi:MAG: hypothetical protein KDK30_02525 [Leptospiraceae bacterium]|nr:hypothetical protein [Leptospiraceae bacterium]MCB1321487.1 hypothetical protein [Leptospiraceae bacterium]